MKDEHFCPCSNLIGPGGPAFTEMRGGWNSVHGDAVATSDEAETLRGLMHAILEMLDSGFIQAKMRGEIVDPKEDTSLPDPLMPSSRIR